MWYETDMDYSKSKISKIEVLNQRSTDNTMAKRRRTDNTMAKRRSTDNTMAKRRNTDNTMAKRRRTDNTMAKRKMFVICHTVFISLLYRKNN
jgi:hypothetical protein